MLSPSAKVFSLGIICLALIMIPLVGVPSASAARMLQVTPSPVTATPIAPSRTETPSAQPTSAAPAGNTYVVKPGDSLWTIASKVYGNGAQYILIQRANYLPDRAVLQTGSTLLIPSLNETPVISPSPTAVPITVSPTATITPESPRTPTVSAGPTPVVDPPLNNSLTFLAPFIQLGAYIFSGFCFIGSLICAYLSLDSFRHSRPYVRRRQIGNRIRVGL